MQLLKHYTGNSKHFKSNSVYSCFRFGPFREGCAVTIATAIRRALFQDIPSTAIVQVIFQHPTDEFSTLEGIQESTLDFLLNIKNLAIRGYCDGYVKGGISKKGPAIIKAKDIFLPYPLSVVDPDHYIGKINAGVSFHCDFILTTSKGLYFPVAKKSWLQSSSLFINADFSSTQQANFRICEDKRQEWVEFEIYTNGSITPINAFRLALLSLLYEFEELYTKVPNLLVNNTNVLGPSGNHVEHLYLRLANYRMMKYANVQTKEDFFTYSPGALQQLANQYKLSF